MSPRATLPFDRLSDPTRASPAALLLKISMMIRRVSDAEPVSTLRSSDPSSIARDGCFRGRPCGRYGACAGQQDHIWLTLLLRMRIAIVHIGAPAGGMNPARRSAVSYCITRGHTTITVHSDPGLNARFC
jgi:hypothetical protein